MDQDRFTEAYFKMLTKKLLPHGYEPKKLIDSIWVGTAAMVRNTGQQTNEEAFWKKFTELNGEQVLADKSLFEEFYQKDFQQVKDFCGYNPKAAQMVAALKQRGFRLALATNPIFPAVATESRIGWAGLAPEDFEWYTTYENSSYCKPNPDYYRALLEKLKVQPEECLMVGNDASEDAAALKVGMSFFLLTDCLINKENKDISEYPQGDFDKLLEFVNEL
ncbi:HAD family hydrolase [Lachnospiraceae bacterium oral taxon 500]|nr:HAD family hydrolase [Lachnospiraceae bacterium oral taxon 500]